MTTKLKGKPIHYNQRQRARQPIKDATAALRSTLANVERLERENALQREQIRRLRSQITTIQTA